MVYFLFLDETGDPGLGFVDPNFPLFLLCGCVIERKSLIAIKTRLDAFKLKYFQTTQVILHSREIRKCEGPFQILFDLNIKGRFYKDLNAILADSDYCLIGSGIDKAKHLKKYGKGAKDPYALSLSFIMERLIFYLDKFSTTNHVKFVFEKRGKYQDRLLLRDFKAIMRNGTEFVTPERLQRKITGSAFYKKYDNITGLQIADLCAYPMARHWLHPEEPYLPFRIVENKLYSNKDGKYMGWGFKVFP